MKKKCLLAPSILSADFSCLAKEAKKLEKAGADLIHADVMDGHFVENLTIGPDFVQAIRRSTRLAIDTHLMVTDPDKYVDAFIEAGSNYISFHAEACKNVPGLVERLKKKKVKAGLAINPDTPVKRIRKFLPLLDFVLVMTVYPGRSGQSIIPDAIAKIGELKRIAKTERYKYFVEVDGGIKVENCRLVLDEGVDMIVSGSGVFGGKGINWSVKAFGKEFDSYLKKK